MSVTIASRFEAQRFANAYALVDGVAMHEENGARFQIPPQVIKKHVRAGYFVELRLDSPRFSLHQEDAARCSCPACNAECSKPILRHAAPASLDPLPAHKVPSRGWGEDFWVRVTSREGPFLQGIVDNLLCESRLHGLRRDDEICFHEHHILAVHDLHRQDLVLQMDVADLKELARWLATLRE